MLYRNFTTEAEINAQYDPAQISNRDAAIERFEQLSAAAVAKMPNRYSSQFGASAAEYVDIYPSGVANAPVHVFIHGGYWRALDARQFAFVAQNLVDQGITVVLTNYGLCPDVAIGDIVQQTRAAIAWVANNVERLDIDIARLSLSGHSAGGHLAAMMLTVDWAAKGLPTDLIKAVFLFSGLFDLGPFPHSWLQPSLKLTDRDVANLSPLFLPVKSNAKVQIRYGGLEQSEFARQSQSYADYLASEGLRVECKAVIGADHFTVLDPFLLADSALVDEIANIC